MTPNNDGLIWLCFLMFHFTCFFTVIGGKNQLKSKKFSSSFIENQPKLSRIKHTVEFVYNSFAYNVNSPTTLHFAWSRQNSYLLCTFRFAYNGIAYNVNSNITAPFFIPQTYFVRLQRHSSHSSLAGTVECS